ncbi:helix-turn-helix domain-containing protein [Gordonia humi]|nr:transcriptional regulator [Gordonia humi]
MVLAALREASEPVTVADLTATLDLPATTIRFHLRALTDDSLADAHTDVAAGPGRPSVRYRARSGMDPAGPREYEMLSHALVAALDAAPGGPELAAAAGRRIGAGRARCDVETEADLTRVLADLGFDPEIRPVGEIRLRRCPFLETARENPAVTCSVHRGLMQGVLDAHRVDVEVRLDAFVDDDHCTATLSRVAG